MQVYQDEESARPFEQDLFLHLVNGWVVSTPEVFVMGRPVKVGPGVGIEDLRDPHKTWPIEQQNAWWVYVLAGDLRAALRFLPYPLKFLAFERANAPRVYRLDEFLSRCTTTRPFTAPISIPISSDPEGV